MSRKQLTLVAMGALLGACQEPVAAPVTPGGGPQAQVVQFWEGSASVAWNQTARDLIVKYGTGAIPAIRVLTLLTVAQYNAIIGTEDAALDPVHPSDAAAVGGASAAVLTYLYPAEAASLEARLDALEAAPGWPGNQNDDIASGEAIGRSVAAAVIARARTDGFFAPFTGTVPVCPGCWLAVPTPPAFPTLGQARTWFLTSGDQFRPPPPPAFGSAEFLTGLAEVRQIADTRTFVQDSIAKFWALPVGTISPAGYWNKVGAELAMQYRLGERRTAHVLALMNMAAYDAIIASHEAKFTYWLIRPSQADPGIHLAIGLPSFPSYPSNHAAVSTAYTTVMDGFFPSERPGLDAGAADAGLSRIYGGIHYRFDVEAGSTLGRTIGQYALDHDVVGHGPLVLR